MAFPCRTVTFCLVGLIVVLGRSAQGQDPPVATDPVIARLDANVSAFFDELKLNTKKAFDILLTDSKRLRLQTKAMETLVERTRKIPEKYGTPHGTERIATHRIGKDVVILKYLYKCENHPVVWYFTYYRDQTSDAEATQVKWQVIAVRFDTDLGLLAL
jgi:hypothetical protein